MKTYLKGSLLVRPVKDTRFQKDHRATHSKLRFFLISSFDHYCSETHLALLRKQVVNIQ